MIPTFVLQDSSGRYIQHLIGCSSFTSSASVGAIPEMSFKASTDNIPSSLLYNIKDAQLSVIIKDGKYSYFDNKYLLSSWGSGVAKITTETVLRGHGMETLLSRRIVKGDEDTTIGYKEGTPEDIMLEVVQESLGDGASNPRNRSLTTKGLKFIPILGLSNYTIQSTIAWANVLDVLRDLQQITKDNGHEFFYSIQPTMSNQFLFTVSRLRINDRTSSSANPIILPITSPELVDIDFEYDSTNVTTNAFVNFSDNIGSELKEYEKFQGLPSPFIRSEYYEQTSSEFTQEWDRIANRIFAQNRPTYVLKGKIAQSERFKYGRDWKMGTVFTVMDGIRKIDVQVRGVGLEYSKGLLSTYGLLEGIPENYYGI